MKNNSKFKRIIAGFLCAVLSLGALPMSAFAFTAEPGKTCEAFYGHKYTGSDGNTYHSPESYQAIHYDTAGNQTVRSHNGGGARATLWLRDDSGERQVMCIESGVDYGAYENYESVNGKNSAYFQNLPATAQYGIMLASIYGWAPDRAVPVSGCNEDDFSIATQTIYWEYQQLLRVSPASRTTNSFGIDKDTYYNGIKGRPAEKCYNWILEQMQRHATVPSFASNQKQSAQTYTLKYDPVKKNYSLTLTDSNNTLADINFTDSRISVSRSGNKYTFTSNTMIENAVGIKAQKKIAQPMGKFLVWGNVGKQTMCSGAEDPVYFYFNIKTETTGIGHIIKHSEDGVVGGISFTISGNGVNKTVTTKDDGTVDIELMPGVYTVTEQTIDKYVPQNVQRVTIVSGGTSNVTFSNVLKRGDLKVIKSSEDNFVKGVKFHLFGTSLSGIPVDEYAVTDKSGVATFSDVLISGSTPYTLEEVDTAIRYVVPPTQTAPVKWKEVTNRSVDNILKKFAVTVTKSDYEEGTAQGDATLAGAVYGIYKGDTLIDEYVTDENGQFTTKEYICDTDWTIREIKPSEGYLLDDMNKEYGDGANPVILKSEFIMSLCEQLIGGNNLGAKQKSIIDRCTASVYRTYQQNDYQGTVPTLQDFRDELLKQDEPEAKEIALAIELFTHGSLNTFAKPTNVDTNSYLICYDILDLGKQLMPIGMLVVLDSILNRITQNRAKGKKTFIFIDEIYLLFQHEYSANFLFTLWKRVRKYGAYASGITQNVDDLLQSHTARTMLANSEFIIMLNQAATDRIELAKLLNISDLQMSYITNVEAGHGLIKVGSSLVPFVNKFPTNTQLYKLMTTKPGEGV